MLSDVVSLVSSRARSNGRLGASKRVVWVGLAVGCLVVAGCQEVELQSGADVSDAEHGGDVGGVDVTELDEEDGNDSSDVAGDSDAAEKDAGETTDGGGDADPVDATDTTGGDGTGGSSGSSSTEYGLLVLSEDSIERAEDWLGAEIDMITTTGNAQGFCGTSMITWLGDAKEQELRRVFGNTDRRLVFHFKMRGRGDDTYAPAANGEYNDCYRQTARELIELGMEDTVIRPTAEFNLPWGRYPEDPNNYARAYANLVREMQSVDGADFEFIYSPAGNRLGVTEEAWPAGGDGDGPVEGWPEGQRKPAVAPSLYDGSTVYPEGCDISQAEREEAWRDIRDNFIGMYESFADSVGTDMASVEWGVATREYPPTMGCDNPYFVEKVIEYADRNDWRYLVYWNSESASGGSHLIFPRSESPLEDSSDKFRQMIGDRLGSF